MKKGKKKTRSDHYEKPLSIDGTFDAVVAVAMGNPALGEKKQLKESKEQEKKEGEKK